MRLFVYTPVVAEELMKAVGEIFNNQALLANLLMLGIDELWQVLIHTRQDLENYQKFSRHQLNLLEAVLKTRMLNLGMFPELHFLIAREDQKSPALFQLLRQTGPRSSAERAYMAKKHLDFGTKVEDIFYLPRPLTEAQIELLSSYIRYSDGKLLTGMSEELAAEFDRVECGQWLRDCFAFALFPGFRLRDEFNAFLAPHGLSLDLPPTSSEMAKAKPKY